MNEIILPLFVLTFYIGLIVGAYLHIKYTRGVKVQKKITVKNVNCWVKRVTKNDY